MSTFPVPLPKSYRERTLEDYRQYALESREYTPWITPQDLSFRPDGSVRIGTPDLGFFAQVNNRVRQRALQGLDLESHWTDWITQDLFTLAADKRNDADRQSMHLFNRSGQLIADPETGDFEHIESLSGADAERFLRPDIKYVLESRGYTFDHFKELDFEQATNRLSRDILSISLDDALTKSANTALERVAGGTASFLTGFVDAATVATLGTAGAARSIGAAALRSSSKNPLVRVAATTASKFGRNQSISGSLIDSRYTIEHASSMLGIDAMVMAGGVDLLSQYRENQILEMYYEQPDAGWFSPERFAASATMGWLLGKGIGKLFGIDNALKARQDAIDATVQRMVGDNPTPEAIKAAERIVSGFWDDLRTPNFGDGNRAVEDVVDDMLDNYLSVYDGNLVEGQPRSLYLRDLIIETIENAGGEVRGTRAEWAQANAKIVKAQDDLRELDLQKTRILGNLRGVVTPDGKPRPAPDDFHRALNRELFEEWSEMLRDVEDRIVKATRDKAQGEEAIRKLTDRETLGARLNRQQVKENTAIEILEFLRKTPSYDELIKFLGERNIVPSKRAQYLVHELNRLAEVEQAVKQAKELAESVSESVDDLDAQIHLMSAMREAEEIRDRLPIYTTGKSGTPAATKFSEAMELKQLARNDFNKAEQTKNLKERKSLLARATASIDRANGLIDEVRVNALRGVSANHKRGSEFATYLESHRVVPVSGKSQADARAFLEAHYLETGNPPVLRNNNWINRVLYSNIANNIAGWGTPRPVMEQMINESPHMQSLLMLIGDISHVNRSFDSKRSFVESVDVMRQRYNRHTAAEIMEPLVALRKAYKDDIVFNDKLKQAYRIAAGLTDSTNDKLVNALAEGMGNVYRRVEVEANRQRMLRPNPKQKGQHIHVQAMPAFGKDTPEAVKAQETLIDVYHEYLIRTHNPVTNPKDPTRRAVLHFMGVIAPNKKRSKSTEENVWAMRNLRVMEGEEVTIRIDGTETKLNGEINRDLSTLHVDALFTRDNLAKLEFLDGDGVARNVETEYLANFDEAMKFEAETAVQNLVAVSGQAKYSRGRAEAPTASSTKVRRANANDARKIPMEVVLDQRVLDTGMINLNPLLDAQHYWFSFAYDVYEQRQLNALLGSRGKYGRNAYSELTADGLPVGVDFDTFLDFALDMHKASPNATKYTDKHYEDVRRFITQTRDALSGRNFIAHEQDGFTTGILQFISQTASIGVNANVALMMPMTEIVLPTLIHLVGKGGKGVRMQALLKSFGGLNRKQRVAMGKTLEQATLQNRVLADSGYYTDEVVLSFAQRFAAPFQRFKRAVRGEGTARSFRAATEGPGGRFANAAVAGAEVFSETTRNLSSELIQTSFGQGIFGRFHMNMVQLQMKNIMRAQADLSRLAGQPVNEKILRGVARKAGLDFVDMQEMIQSGILNYDVQPIRLSFLEKLSKNVDNWSDIDSVHTYMNTLSPDERRLMNEMFDRVLDYATAKTDRDITNPGVFDRPMHSTNPIVSTVHRFLSFSRGFRSGKMQELANAGIATAATGYVGYTLAEVANRNLISIWSHGESLEDISEKWAENPERMLIYSLGGLPYLGGGQSFANEVLNTFTGDRFSPSYSPSLSIFGANVRAMQKVLSGDDVTEQDVRRATKMFPVLNNAAVAPLLNMALDDEKE